MSEGASEPYKQCILQLCKQDPLLVFTESFIQFRYLLCFTSPTLLPLNATTASFPTTFLWVWATQICVYHICRTRRFLSVRAVLGPLAEPWGCLLSRWGKEPRAGWENPAETRLRDSTARSRSVQVNCNLCNPSLLLFLTENTRFPALWIPYGKYGRFSLFLLLQQSSVVVAIGCFLPVPWEQLRSPAQLSLRFLLFLLLALLWLYLFAPVDF